MGNLLIETTLLNTFLDDNSWTYVKAGNQFVRKKASDLNRGDLVVIQNEAIHKTLDEIIPILQQSMRYQIAEETIHEKNCNDKYIPKLRILLLEGLADPETPELRKKILREGSDFTQQEYTHLRRTICKIVDIGEDAVNDWLKGETLAPANWRNFQKLISINPAFEEIYQSYEQNTGYFSNYQLYVGLRRTIMSYLTKRTGKKEGSETKRKSPRTTERKTGVYTDEIELVVSHFIKEIDDTYSAARITKIRRIDEKKKKGKPIEEEDKHKPEPNLKKAIITEKIPQLELRDMNQIKNEHYIVSNALFDLLNRYVVDKIKHINIDSKKTAAELLKIKLLPAMPSYLYSRVINISPSEKEIFRINSAHVYEDKKYNKITIERVIEETYQNFLKDIKENKIDELLRLEPNTAANIIDHVNQYRNALPRKYFETQLLRIRTGFIRSKIEEAENRRTRKEFEKELTDTLKQHETVLKYLKETYHLIIDDKKSFFSSFHQELKGIQKIEELGREETIDELRREKRFYEQQGHRFYSKHEIQQVLTRLGIHSAIKLYDKRTFI
ncbi:hypothetical protein HZA96_07320 [Candidatus Woesearchaeota archaeon]|nr:hypothetical protein [Candidatus Woesearchaeota archaeon]